MQQRALPQFFLTARTAADMMTSSPVAISAETGATEAAGALADRGISALPAIDNAGQLVGVVTRTDILRGPPPETSAPPTARVRDVMTPCVLTVTPDTSSTRVMEKLLARRLHRLFVVDQHGRPIGVISTLDVLHHLHPSVRAILCPMSFSPQSFLALERACAIAAKQDARLIVLHVQDGMEAKPPETSGESPWRDVRTHVPSSLASRVEYRLESGDPGTAIIRVAHETNCDLIVMGKNGRARLGGMTEGHVTAEVVRRAPCLVSVVDGIVAGSGSFSSQT